jgi:hypothetical protein
MYWEPQAHSKSNGTYLGGLEAGWEHRIGATAIISSCDATVVMSREGDLGVSRPVLDKNEFKCQQDCSISNF